ncbi:hypothetical protein BH09DEP1_BH09DEP1_0820 [soil metagenome]
MKYIFAFSLIFISTHADKLPLPTSKRDCFVAYSLFKALVKTCTHANSNYNGGSTPNPEQQSACVKKNHNSFITECQLEAGIIARNLD